MTREVTPAGAFAIAASEGVVPTRYIDVAGHETWGIGHTAAAGDPDPKQFSYAMPPQEKIGDVVRDAWRVFLRDLTQYRTEVTAVFGPDLEPHELDGLTMWHYNTGGAFTTSAAKHWHAGAKGRAVGILQQWNKITKGGRKVVSSALVERRAEEAKMILEGVYPVRQIAIWPTDGEGRVVWRPLERFDEQRWEALVGRKKTSAVADPTSLAAAIVSTVGMISAAVIAWWEELTAAIGGIWPW